MMEPIFIHSLFRSGSTYIFNAFRRASPGYCCYQEALHEQAFIARDNPELLDNGLEIEKMALLRHPSLAIPYFQELYNVWPSWQGTISSSAIYDEYFAPSNADLGLSYWRSLSDASIDRPVFQECRSSGRIEAIRQRLGGFHIYLWRNPWDQWWSYKVAPYFDLSSQLIINAPSCPDVVRRLRSRIGFQPFEGDNIEAAISYFSKRPLGSEESYLTFYLLWCLGLQSGIRHANLLLNIDHLSHSSLYRQEIATQLREAGIDGLDFSDCHVPQGYFDESDRNFFTALEDQVHQWLSETGWSQHELNSIQVIRAQFSPRRPIASNSAACFSKLAEQLVQARALTRRYESSAAKISRAAYSALLQSEFRAKYAEACVKDADARARDAEARARDAITLAESYHAQLVTTLASKSWLITKPLRWWFDVLTSMRNLPGKSHGACLTDKSLLALPSEPCGLTPRAREIYGDLLKSHELVRGRKL